jgi:branched-chain amino acid transport system ATP-binding protein
VTPALLATRRLNKAFGGVIAVNGVDLEVRTGALHAVIGPNGAGKTTLFHLLTGVHGPTDGTIEFDGREVSRLKVPQRVALGMARSYQLTNVFRRLTVRENLTVAAQRAEGVRWRIGPVGGQTRARIEQLVTETMELLRIGAQANQPCQTLPYGAQRLVDIGIAMCCRPKLLLLDEPTSGLSTAELGEATAVIERLRERYTVLLIEHNMDLVMGLADVVTVLDFGEVIAHGRPAEIQRNPDVQRAYFGRAA